MTAALNVLSDAGLDVTKMTPTSEGYNYVYDVKTGRMLLLDNNQNVVAPTNTTDSDKYDTFAIVHNETEKEEWVNLGYGVYLASDYTNSKVNVNKAVSVDIASNNVTNLVVTDSNSTNNIIINAKLTNLTIELEKGAVDFYGDTLNVVAMTADHSLHIYGHIQELELKAGKVVVKSNGEVNTIDATNATNASVEVSGNGNIGAVISNDSNIVSSGNVTVVAPNEEQKLFAGGTGSENSPYLIAKEEQFLNINEMYKSKTGEGVNYTGNVYCFKQVSNLTLSVPENGKSLINAFTGTYDGNNNVLEFNKTENVKDYGYLFGLIFDNVVLKNIEYVLTANQPISLIYSSDWNEDTLNLELNNVNISSNGDTILANHSNFSLYNCFATYNFTNVKYINCTNSANLNNSGTSTGVFIGSGPFVFKDDNSKVEYINCVNNGNISGGYQVGVLYGNGAYVGEYNPENGQKIVGSDYNNHVYVENLINTGSIVSLIDNGRAAVGPGSDYLIENYQDNTNGLYIVGGYFNGKNVYLSQVGNNYYINHKNSSDYTFKVAFNINRLDNAGDTTASNTTKYFYDVQYDASLNRTNILLHKAYDMQKAKETFTEDEIKELSFDENGIAMYIKDSIMYFIFENKEIGRNTTDYPTPGECGISIYVYAYDSNGMCIGVKTIK